MQSFWLKTGEDNKFSWYHIFATGANQICYYASNDVFTSETVFPIQKFFWAKQNISTVKIFCDNVTPLYSYRDSL